MMQSAKNRVGDNAAVELNCTRKWSILVQRQVRSIFIVTALVIEQQSPEMALAEDDDVVEALSPVDLCKPNCVAHVK